MSDKVNKSVSITPPVSGQNTIVIGSAASSAVVKIPDDWTGWITVQADGVKAWARLGDATSITADQTAVSTVNGTSKAVTAHGTGECQMIAEDGSEPFNLEEVRKGDASKSIYLAHIESATGGFLRIIRSSGPVDLS